MQFGGPAFVIAIVALSMAGWVITTWIRAKHGYPIENEWTGMTYKGDQPAQNRQVEQLTSENSQLKGQITRLEERIAVLERIATDPAERTAREIEKLR
jgi:predicted RNase H-like nuclease (RuvC/YqgF family)